MTNPNAIEIHGEKTIVKLCKFGAEHNMEGCTFTEIVERLVAEYQRAKELIPDNHKFFSYDVDGIQFHETIDEAKKNIKTNGINVVDDANYHDVCYGIVLGPVDHPSDQVTTELHRQNDD